MFASAVPTHSTQSSKHPIASVPTDRAKARSTNWDGPTTIETSMIVKEVAQNRNNQFILTIRARVWMFGKPWWRLVSRVSL